MDMRRAQNLQWTQDAMSSTQLPWIVGSEHICRRALLPEKSASPAEMISMLVNSLVDESNKTENVFIKILKVTAKI
jgi:hypothetical protein